MTDLWFPVVTVALGFVVGLLSFDLVNRKYAMHQLKEAKKELTDSASKLRGLHNDLSGKIMELEEKVAAHEYQLTARVKPKAPNPWEKPK